MAGRGPRNSNVMPFRSPGGSSGSDLAIKAFAVIFYATLAYLVTFSHDPMWMLTFLGLLYYIFIYRRLHRTGWLSQNKILIIALAVLFAFVFKLESIALITLSGLYWLMVARPSRNGEPPYFLRFHILNGIIYYLFLVIGFGILNAVIRFAFALLMFVQQSEAETMLAIYQDGFQLLLLAVYGVSALYFAAMAVMGRTPYVRYVTDNVRQWA